MATPGVPKTGRRPPGTVPSLKRSGMDRLVARDLEAFLKTAQTSLVGIEGDPGTPSTILAGVDGDEGESTSRAAADHVHPISTAAPSVRVALGGSPDEGTGSALMRADARLVLDDGGATLGQVPVWDGSDWVPTTPSSGGANTVRVTVSFGASFTDRAQTVVTGEAWVTATSCLSGTVVAPAGVDPDELRLLDFKVVISDLVVGVGFTVTVYSEPEAEGDYEVMVIGV